jgi:hypothetical protein
VLQQKIKQLQDFGAANLGDTDMKQYKITTENITTDSPDDCYLAPDDPIHEVKIMQYLGGINAQQRLTELKAANQGSNISVTGTEKAELMRKHDIKPGTPEWFKLWFSLPYMIGSTTIDKKNNK